MTCIGPITGDAIPTIGMLAADSSIVKGDVVIIASGKLDEDNTDPAADTIVGVALHASTTDAILQVALALPHVMFEANIVTDADGGTDVSSGAIATHIGVQWGIAEALTFAVVDIASNTAANKAATTWRWGYQPTLPSAGAHDATVAVVNPRVQFTFCASRWAQESTA
jgi:hypothetical protein